MRDPQARDKVNMMGPVTRDKVNMADLVARDKVTVTGFFRNRGPYKTSFIPAALTPRKQDL